MKKDHLKKGFSNVQLYNIAMDPSETTNLIDMRPDIALDLLGKLAEYQKTALLPNYPKNDRRYDDKMASVVYGRSRCSF